MANRLSQASSHYLRQHGDDPVDWWPWCDEALDRARLEDRPVFLSIGYSSCHWCHVMQHEVFQDREVAEALNRHFVCIKVDREDRPDIDGAYMEAAMAMTGSGGWPLNLFLTPDLRPFLAGTYIPRGRFLALVGEVQQAWQTRRSQVEALAGEVAGALARPVARESSSPPDLEKASGAARQILAAFDPVEGGLRGPMKFPMAPTWSFLLHFWRKTGSPQAAEALRRTLNAMATGGIRDPLSGGFHRYATDRQWRVPHFEKMLYDNALLAMLFLEAGRALGEVSWEETARETLDFLLAEMRAPGGAFCASLDADDAGGEGAFYRWRPAEVRAVLGNRDGEVMAALLGLGDSSEEEQVPWRRLPLEEVARRFGLETTEVQVLWQQGRVALREARKRRPAPFRDPKVVASWNGLAIRAMARAGAVLREPRYLEAARVAAGSLWSVHRAGPGVLHRSSREGLGEHPAMLEDHAHLALGLLELFQATGESSWLATALELTDEAIGRFRSSDGVFYTAPEGLESPLGRRIDFHDQPTPSGPASMVELLVRIGALAGRTDYREIAEETLGRALERALQVPSGSGAWLDAALLLAGPFYEVEVDGPAEDPATRALLAAFRDTDPFPAVLRPPVVEQDGDLHPPAEGLAAPTARVCTWGRCLVPTSDPRALAAAIRQGWHC